MTTEQNALTLPQRAAVALGTAEHEIKLHELVKSSADIVAVIDPAGREQCHRIGMNLKNARTTITKTGKAAREDATAFSAAVITEEKRLIAIIETEEARIFKLRDDFDAVIEAEKQAKIAAERARIDAIASQLEALRQYETDMVRSASRAFEMQTFIDAIDLHPVTPEIFQERHDEAVALKTTVMASMKIIHAARVEFEATEAKAKADRIAEDARRAVEAAMLEAQRVAQQAEAQRLAAIAAELEAKAQAERDQVRRNQEEADARAYAADQERKARIAAEDAQRKAEDDERNRQQAEQQAQINAARKLLEEEQDRNVAHGYALEMNEAHDAAAEVERVRLQALADQQLADHHAEVLRLQSLPAEPDTKAAEKLVLEKAVLAARAALADAISALEAFICAPENNVFDNIDDACGKLEDRLENYAHKACIGAGNRGAEEYEQEFIVDAAHYLATLKVSYDRHDKTYYYIDETDFTYKEIGA